MSRTRFSVLFVGVVAGTILAIFGENAALGSEYVKLTADDATANNEFGHSVAISGNTALVGALLAGDAVSHSGSAYVFQDDGLGNWNQIAELTADDAFENSDFGISVSLGGNTALVGAQAGSGSAYVFRDDGLGNWSQNAKLKAADFGSSDNFGNAVALSGNTALIGSKGDDDGGSNSGSAYLFREDNTGTWNEIAKLTASDAGAGDRFGFSVAVDGNTALVGAYLDDHPINGEGSAYVFQDDGLGNWDQIAKLTANDAMIGDQLGHSVALSGNLALVGSRRNNSESGAAYLFQDDSLGNWNQIAKLTADDAATSALFGQSVDLNGNLALVGAWNTNNGGIESGAAYLFQDDGLGNWSQLTKFTAPDAMVGDRFGWSVALSSSNALVGAVLDDDAGSASGSAYLFNVPEPSSAILLSLAGVALTVCRRSLHITP